MKEFCIWITFFQPIYMGSLSSHDFLALEQLIQVFFFFFCKASTTTTTCGYLCIASIFVFAFFIWEFTLPKECLLQDFNSLPKVSTFSPTSSRFCFGPMLVHAKEINSEKPCSLHHIFSKQKGFSCLLDKESSFIAHVSSIMGKWSEWDDTKCITFVLC